MKDGDVLLLENTRFHKGEEKNDPAFVAELAELGDLYVNDAFSAAHRAHASTEGLAHKLPAFAGRSMQAELDALGKALEAPKRPLVAIVGGAKISSKLDLLGNLVAKVDALVIGGGMANTFLNAQGFPVGKSLCEKDLAETAREIMAKAQAARCAHPAAGRRDRRLSISPPMRPRMITASMPFPTTGHDARHRPAFHRPRQSLDQRGGDRRLERAARRFRTRRLRARHVSSSRAMSPSAPRRASSSQSPAAATRWRRSTAPASPTISLMSRRRAAPSLSGWKARRCRASRRFAF